MVDLSKLSPQALDAAMRGGADEWGQHGGAEHHILYVEPITETPKGKRRMCRCGCRHKVTHRVMANGVCLGSGCEVEAYRVKRRLSSFAGRG